MTSHTDCPQAISAHPHRPRRKVEGPEDAAEILRTIWTRLPEAVERLAVPRNPARKWRLWGDVVRELGALVKEEAAVSVSPRTQLIEAARRLDLSWKQRAVLVVALGGEAPDAPPEAVASPPAPEPPPVLAAFRPRPAAARPPQVPPAPAPVVEPPPVVTAPASAPHAAPAPFIAAPTAPAEARARKRRARAPRPIRAASPIAPAPTEPTRPRVDRIAPALDRLLAKFPRAWHVKVGRPDDDADPVVIKISARGGHRSEIVCLFHRGRPSGEIPAVVDRLRGILAETGRGSARAPSPLVLAPYLTTLVRERFRADGIGYADATGNVAIEVRDPFLRIEARGKERDPKRPAGRPPALRGEKARRVMETLRDLTPPITGQAVARAIGCDQGYVSCILTKLASEGVIVKVRGGPVTAVNRGRLDEKYLGTPHSAPPSGRREETVATA